MSRFPQGRAFFRARCPTKFERAMFVDDLLYRGRLIIDDRLARAVELEKQCWRQAVACLRVAIHEIELLFIDDLDSSHRHTELNGRNHGVGSAFDAVER